jgi:hypothetical protein
MLQLIQEAKRLQKLAGILTEAEEAKAEQTIEQGLQNLLGDLKSTVANIKPSPQDGKVDELVLTIAGLVAGAPGLMSVLGQGVDWITKKITGGNINKTVIGQALQKAGHKLEDAYIGLIGDALKAAYPKLYTGQNVLDPHSDLYDKAHGIYAAILAAAAIGSGVEAANAIGIAVKAIEGGLATFKTAEVAQLAQKIAAA